MQQSLFKAGVRGAGHFLCLNLRKAGGYLKSGFCERRGMHPPESNQVPYEKCRLDTRKVSERPRLILLLV